MTAPVLALSPPMPALLGMAFAAVALFVMGLPGLTRKWMDRRMAEGAEMGRRLHRPPPTRFDVAKGPLIGVAIALAGGAAGLWSMALVAGFAIWKVIDGEPAAALRKRRKAFDGQFVDSLIGLSNCLKAGMSLPQAVEQNAKDMPAPCCEEYDTIFQEYRLGKPIEQAFGDASERIESKNYDLAVLAFKAGKERGGNVAEVFEKIGASIREIWRLEQHIETVSTEGRSSARFMTFMPAVFLGLLYVMDAESTSLLFTDPVGMGILTGVVVLNLIGHFWIRRILAVDV